MDGICREAIKVDRPFERSTNRARDRQTDRPPERSSDRRQHRSSDRSANRTKDHVGRNRSCDRILDRTDKCIGTRSGEPCDRVNVIYDKGNTIYNEKGIYDRTNKVQEKFESSRVWKFGDRVAGKKKIGQNVEQDKRLGEDYSNDSDDGDHEGDEVCIWVDDKQLWVSGVNAETTCGELVKALLPHHRSYSKARTTESDWVITEMWRSMEQPLNNEATILDIWNAWGDAQNEIRFNLRYVDSSGDSGRGSPPSPKPSRRRASRHCQRRQLFPELIKAQGDTLQRQADRLREQDRQINLLEEQTHRTRMAKHGPNYLLESYLRDIARHNELANNEDRTDDYTDNIEGQHKEVNKKSEDDGKQEQTNIVQTGEAIDNQARSSEATDSPAGNSDSGVGVSGSPPRPTKRRSRGRHLLREHYLTKELADICQINANRIQTKSDDTSENSADELSRIQQQIDILEKLAIVNKRLQREEELIVRLGVKLRRYLCEDQISYIESEEQIVTMLNGVRKQMDESSKEIENTAIEVERADYQLEKRKNLLEILSKEVEEVEQEGQFLEVQVNQPHGFGGLEQQMLNDVQYTEVQNYDNRLCNIPLDISNNQFVNVSYNFNNLSNYPLDTLV